MIATFNDDTSVSLAKKWFDETGSVLIWSPNWRSLKQRHGETARVDVRLDGNLEYDHFWNETSTILYVEKDGEIDSSFGAFSMSLGKKNTDDFIISLALSSGFKIEADGKSLGLFDSKYTRAAALELHKCVTDGRTNSGQDPFAD